MRMIKKVPPDEPSGKRVFYMPCQLVVREGATSTKVLWWNVLLG